MPCPIRKSPFEHLKKSVDCQPILIYKSISWGALPPTVTNMTTLICQRSLFSGPHWETLETLAFFRMRRRSATVPGTYGSMSLTLLRQPCIVDRFMPKGTVPMCFITLDPKKKGLNRHQKRNTWSPNVSMFTCGGTPTLVAWMLH